MRPFDQAVGESQKEKIVFNENHTGAKSLGNPGQTVNPETELDQPEGCP